jgi:threonylcarbamoyladenosine tRNA methylthiotransferase MtaB
MKIYLWGILKPKKNIAFQTLGCKLNFSETSSISRLFDQEAYQKVDTSESMDVFVLNTCSVTNHANREARQIVRKIKKENPHATVVVTGCYAQLKPQEIADIEGVDLVLGAQDKFKIKEHLDDFEANGLAKIHSCDITAVEGFNASYSAHDRTRTFLKVQDGCDYNCSFCTIPLARGHSRSDSIAGVLANIEELNSHGVQEIILTGVNLGDFGKGYAGQKKNEESFLSLLQAIEAQALIPRVRISSIEPNLLTDEIIDFVADSACVMPHFHIPLQSGSNHILGAMRRRYKRELYQERVQRIKTLMPHCCIGVDVIVGFPGEKEEHFQETHDFLHSLDISYLHVFTYSERENTLADTMKEVVPNKIRQDRNLILRNLSEKKMNFFKEQHLGQSRATLFEHANKDGFMQGYTDNYIRIAQPYEAENVNRITSVKIQ